MFLISTCIIFFLRSAFNWGHKLEAGRTASNWYLQWVRRANLRINAIPDISPPNNLIKSLFLTLLILLVSGVISKLLKTPKKKKKEKININGGKWQQNEQNLFSASLINFMSFKYRKEGGGVYAWQIMKAHSW